MNRRKGWSLFEVLLILAIFALFAAVVLPGGTRARERAEVRLSAVSFGEDLRRAFVIAIARGQRVVLCPAAERGGELCGAEAAFDRGWLAFFDRDGDRDRSPDEPLLLRNAPAREGIRIRSSAGRPRVVIQPDGGNRGTNATFVVCGRHGAATAMSVVLSNDGRIRHARPSPAEVATRCG